MQSPGEAFRLDAAGICTTCGKRVEGWIAFNEATQIIDSGGFMIFANGIACDKCIEEGTGMHPDTPVLPGDLG